MSELEMLLAVAFAIIAALYSSVGQGGGTAYFAAMMLAGVAPDQIRGTALALNVLVGLIGIYRFGRAGHIKIRNVLPFVAGSVPAVLLGSRLELTATTYSVALGVIFLAVAIGIVSQAELAKRLDAQAEQMHMPVFAAVFVGVCLGLFSATGTGVAVVLLAPLILLANWLPTRDALGTAVVLIWLHSVVMLLMLGMPKLPPAFPYWLVAVAIGGLVGTHLGVKVLSPRALRWILGIVLTTASARILLLT